ncbi:hypothetical protein BC936DRAFT_140723 [Jimgerdemannia flammicorona]|uniref:non-specific serine/threonine protein kinase n=1 Tax=Jimgerdemannia flammicorona TaxID=994334 RepID=A0A433ACK6_9FUNG|nr:hypothetical protein BC936DRAFT_140723 [Jimgerdemannia flammicorona]
MDLRCPEGLDCAFALLRERETLNACPNTDKRQQPPSTPRRSFDTTMPPPHPETPSPASSSTSLPYSHFAAQMDKLSITSPSPEPRDSASTTSSSARASPKAGPYTHAVHQQHRRIPSEISTSTSSSSSSSAAPLPPPAASRSTSQNDVHPKLRRDASDFEFGATLGEGSYSTVSWKEGFCKPLRVCAGGPEWALRGEAYKLRVTIPHIPHYYPYTTCLPLAYRTAPDSYPPVSSTILTPSPQIMPQSLPSFRVYVQVMAARDKHTGSWYAIKILDKKHIIRHKKVKYVDIEKNTLNRMNHPGIVRLYWTFHDQQQLYFVLDLARNGELLTYIKKVRANSLATPLGAFDLPTTQFYAAEILSAIEHVHEMGVIHSILLDENMHIKLTDFGTAKILESLDDGGKDSLTRMFPLTPTCMRLRKRRFWGVQFPYLATPSCTSFRPPGELVGWHG